MPKVPKQETLEEKLRDEYAADPALFCIRLRDMILMGDMRAGRLEGILSLVDPKTMMLVELRERLAMMESRIPIPKPKGEQD